MKEIQTHCSIGKLETDYSVPPPLEPLHIGISMVTCQFTSYTSQTIIYVSCIILLQQNWCSVPIKTGWWSCTPREEMTCSCGEDVQTESHVLLKCPQTVALRLEHNNLNFDSLTSFMSNQGLTGRCFYTHKVLSTVT